jgi:hypothetical protein
MARWPAAFAAAALVALALTAGDDPGPSLSEPVWVAVAPGIDFARVESRRYCREGSPGVAAIRLDPARCRISPYAETEFAGAEPAGIEAWQSRLGAPVVLNAGLFDESRRQLGILRRSGTDLGGRPHSRWNGLLAAEADSAGLPPADLLDLATPEDRGRADFYRTAVQSMMLYDRTGKKRVRASQNIAPRTLVAVTGSGSLVVVVTEGSYTLWEAADLLRESGWDLIAAMALDGGKESNLAVESAAVRYRSYEAETALGRGWLRSTAPLPAVIAVWPDTGTVDPR